MNDLPDEWIACPTCHAEGEVDMEWIDADHFVSGSGKTCPQCDGAMAIENEDA